MKTLKKTLCLVLAVVMVVGALVLPASAAYKDAKDIDDDYATAVTTLANWKVMMGDDNGNFKPEAAIQRQEMAAIVYRLLTGDNGGYGKDNSAIYIPLATAKFTDVGAKDWAAGYIGYCADKGIIVGTNAEGTTFEPTRNIPGYDVLCMLLRAIGYGKNKEYQGADWAKNIAADATRLGLTKGITTKLNVPSERQEVAQMTYQAAQAARVTWSDAEKDYIPYRIPNQPNSDKNIPLVQTSTVAATAPTTNTWGAPTGGKAATTKVTFTYPVPAKDYTIPAADSYTMLWETYDAVTECDMVDKIGAADEEHWALTYTNGTASKNLWNDNVSYTGAMPFEPTDTVNKIGHEGRHTMVYKNPAFDATKDESAANPMYIFVFVDTYMGVVTNTWGEVTDPAGHVIREAGATVSVSYNNKAVGTGSTASPLSLSITGTFNVGDKIGVNMTNVAGTSPNANVAKVTSTASSKTRSSVTLKTVTAKVTSITTDTVGSIGGGKQIVGFVADGVQYYYNYTFAGDVLTNANIGQTFNLWLGHDNDVLALQAAGVTTGIGVTKSAVVKQINSSAYVVTYTILLPNNTDITIDVVNNDGKAFGSYTAAESYAKGLNDGVASGELVYYTNSGSYYKFSAAENAFRIDAPRANYSPIIESGRAEALFDAYTTNQVVGNTANNGTIKLPGALVNNNTVFFVANYLPDTKSPNPNDYKFTGYSIYEGFQSIPDLGYDPNGTPAALSFQAFDVNGNNIPVAHTNASQYTQFAKYVLVTGATKQTTPPAKIAVKNYAFLMNNDSFKQTLDGYYAYTAIINGTAGQTLQVAMADADAIDATGLYTYAANTNGLGYNTVLALNGIANVREADPFNANFKIARDRYLYSAGVLTVNSMYAPDEAGFKNSGVATYYTVTKDCAVYLVNPTTGTSVKVELSYLASDIYGETCDIWYQLDEFGRINLIYIVDTTEAKPGTPNPAPTTKVTYNVTVNVTAPLTNTTVKYTATVKLAPGTEVANSDWALAQVNLPAGNYTVTSMTVNGKDATVTGGKASYPIGATTAGETYEIVVNVLYTA